MNNINRRMIQEAAFAPPPQPPMNINMLNDAQLVAMIAASLGINDPAEAVRRANEFVVESVKQNKNLQAAIREHNKAEAERLKAEAGIE